MTTNTIEKAGFVCPTHGIDDRYSTHGDDPATLRTAGGLRE
jgi:hypothetical protein